MMSAHPFDIRAVILAKHAQHVVLVHFPIALFISGVALDFAAHWTKRRRLGEAAYINLLLAAAMTVPTVASGLAAWQWALEGQKLKGVLLLHLVFGLISASLICAVWWIHYRARARAHGESMADDAFLPGYRLIVEAAAVAVVAMTGHLGGFLSGVNT
ncbi:MAG TPA: DUF2231 domain-containing protein [Candidatus Acidoferrum sp.]|jgi:uncharacterized membrane protein